MGMQESIIYRKIETKQKEINETELDLFLNKRITNKLHINYSIPNVLQTRETVYLSNVG